MGEVSSNTSVLNSSIDAISAANNEGKNFLNPKTTSCGSTTKIPKNEAVILEQLLKSIQSLYTKLDSELINIKAVGDSFVTMDNFLANESLDLGFEVVSKGVDVEALSSYATESLAELLGKDVPIVQGYNDPDTLNGKKSSSGDSGSSGGSYGSYGGTSGSSGGTSGSTGGTTTTTTEPSTVAPTEAPTVAPTEMPTSVETEPVIEEPTDTPTEAPTEVITEIVTEAPTEAVTPEKPHSETKPTGDYDTKPTYTEVKTEVTIVSTEPIIDEPIVDPLNDTNLVEEPIIEDYVEPDEMIEPTYEDEIPEEIDISDNVIEPTQKKSNGGKVAGAIAAVGLTAGAAAVGYGMYKKTKEDKEYEDYEYEDGGAY